MNDEISPISVPIKNINLIEHNSKIKKLTEKTQIIRRFCKKYYLETFNIRTCLYFICICICFKQICDVVYDYLKLEARISLELDDVDKSRVPGLTICPSNR